jgi:hypothetical protein
MKQKTKDGLIGVAVCIVILTAGVLINEFLGEYSSRSEEVVTGRCIKNNHIQPMWEKLEIGMTKQEVEVVWGLRMNDTLKHNRTGTQEKWYYRCHLNKCIILTFENGILTQWEG